MLGLTAIEFFLFCIVVFVVLYWILPHKMNWVSMIVVVVLLSVLAYTFNPNESDDLSRYYHELDFMRERGHDEVDRAIKEDLYGWGAYRVGPYYFFLISRLPDNRYLPAVSIFIVYGLMFLVMYKAIKRFNVNRLYAFIGIMFFLSTYWYYDELAGIRNGLSFAVAFACSYYHFVERRHIVLCYGGYILSALNHSAGIMPVVLALLVEITFNTSGKFVNFLFIVGAALGTPATSFLAERTDNKFINSIAGKAEDHAVGEIGNLFEYGTMFKVNITVLIVVFLLLIYVSKFLLYNYKLKRFYKYFSLTLYFSVGAIASGLVFVRFVRFILPIIGALMFMIGFQLQNDMVAEEVGLSASYTPIKDTFLYKLKTPVILAFVAYTVVHLWYLCAGSSLNWIHF